MNIGDVAYSAQGRCLCVFFGRTPASVIDRPVSENPVVVIGRTLASPDELREIKVGEKITVSRAEETSFVLRQEDYCDNRKLTQAEIDILVKKLLEEKARQK